MRTVFSMMTGVLSLAVFTAVTRGDTPDGSLKQYYEVRTYVLGDSGDADALDAYLREALLPALGRQQIGPVGVFAPAEGDTNDRPSMVVVIPYRSLEQFGRMEALLARDKAYQSSAKAYLSRPPNQPAYQRIRSELLVAMDCMPKTNVPQGTLENADRVYELRVYESATERLGQLKVDMFNNGEVPIFLDCGIQPIFLGQALVGPQTPNLTYLTVYANDQQRREAWDAFRKHPEWQVLKGIEKYQGTVSHIDKFILKAKPYSRM